MRHGVTTVLLGNCSLSTVYASSEDAADLFERLGDLDRAYEARGFAECSDEQLFDLAARVIAIPKQDPADSFILHAPLELLARLVAVRAVQLCGEVLAPEVVRKRGPQLAQPSQLGGTGFGHSGQEVCLGGDGGTSNRIDSEIAVSDENPFFPGALEQQGA